MSPPTSHPATTSPTIRPYTFYALIRSEERGHDLGLRRLPLNGATQLELTRVFSTGAKVWAGYSMIDFAPDCLHLEDSKAFEVDLPAPLPAPYGTAFAPGGERAVGDLTLPVEAKRTIKAIVAHDTRQGRVIFQLLNRAKIFNVQSSLIPIIYRNGEMTGMTDPGLNVSDHVDAIWVGGRLRFRSFRSASQLIDLTKIFREATDDDIREVMGHRLIGDSSLADPIIKVAGERVRRKFAIIHHNRTLNDLASQIEAVVDTAREFGIDLRLNPGPPKRLVLPTEGNKLTEALNFLTDSYYFSPLVVNRRYYSNSHRRI